MKLAITGANGFIGQYLIAEAIEQGHKVVAISRQPKEDFLAKFVIKFQATNIEDIDVKKCDLNDTKALSEALGNCNCVIHLAASMDGNNQYKQTIDSTNSLIKAANISNIASVMLVSSISVLNYTDPKALSTINEKNPLCLKDEDLGDYARMKRDQEILLQQWHLETGKQFIIIRPGLVYSHSQLSSAHAGYIKKTFGIAATHSGEVPLIKVNELAREIITLFQQPLYQKDIFHLISKPSITQKEYLKQLKQFGQLRIYAPIPWQSYSYIASAVRWLAKKLNKQTPESFRANSVSARQKPFIFSTDKYKQFTKG